MTKRHWRKLARAPVALSLATLVWIPCVHLLYPPMNPHARADALLSRARADWSTPTPRDTATLRASNPEWDFMRRTFVVMAAASRALEPTTTDDARDEGLALMDHILEDTLAHESTEGHAYFLLPYAHRAPFVGTPAGAVQSLFVDGEIAMMLAARLLVAPSAAWGAELDVRVARIRAQMEAGPLLSGESYPDECWTFCNTFALAALRTADAARGTDAHRVFVARWVAVAQQHLVDPATGILVSSYRHDGQPLDGPEGSSIFMSATNLRLVDDAFARDQYARAKRALARSAFGFAWAREWPAASEWQVDVDSGPIVPLVDASAGASGMAVLGARAFGDHVFANALGATLDFAAFPTRDGDALRFSASNAVGDAVILYADTAAPLIAHITGVLARQRVLSATDEGRVQR